MKTSIFRYLISATASLWLAACSNPYALSINEIDYEANQRAGVIQVTDAKLYSREALINERRDEIEYLEELLAQSRTQTFQPQIIRELETITSLAAGLGLAFDPAAGVNFDRALETSAVQQEMELLKLQLQLESLRKDAELISSQISERTEPSTTDLATNDVSTEVTSSAQAAAATQLTDAINNLNTTLGSRLGNAVALPRPSTASVDPSDLFLDRAAYRDLIKSAMSAERLDDLHDKNGNALMRFHFSATVLPPERAYQDTMGVLSMEVLAPEFSEEDEYQLYLLWISYINDNYNLARGRNKATDSSETIEFDFYLNPRLFLVGSGSGLFNTVSVEMPRTEDDEPYCGGFISSIATSTKRCLVLSIAVPLEHDLDSGDAISNVLTQPSAFQNQMAQALRRGAGTRLADDTVARLIGSCSDRSDLYKTREVVVARSILTVESSIREVFRVLLHTAVHEDLTPYQERYIRTRFRRVQPTFLEARRFLDLAAAGDEECGPAAFAQPSDRVAPALFKSALHQISQGAQVRIYDVSPRERAQQVSTVARAAEAIGLAAAIAGQVPSAGVGISGDINYSRSAAGNAQARERVPLVVSFAEPQANVAEDEGPRFGWLLGPRMSLNPKEQKLEFYHYTAPYELMVDLSLPGWWPEVRFGAHTGWAPNWRGGSGSTAITSGADCAASSPTICRTIDVPLSRNSADMSSLTDAIILATSTARSLAPSITDVTPRELSACAGKTTMRIRGDNIWRTEKVIIGGQEFSGSAVRVTPDMSGVLVDVDARALPQAKTEVDRNAAVIKVQILNQDGESFERVTLMHLKPDGSCSQPQPPATGPVIASINPPALSICTRNPGVIVTGKNLNSISSASLNALPGTIADKKASGLTVNFDAARFPRDFAGLDEAMLTLRDSKKSVQKSIVIKNPEKCPEVPAN